jgi:pimeloyl-ACP methyl ester carboxylesterase
MQAFHTGPPGRRLFAAFHPAEGGAARRAVLICQPLHHEYLRIHRALRNLAALLARRGCAVLRFDYYGCGDSEGESIDGDLDRWTDDVSLAADELRRRAGTPDVWFGGVRLGGTLAALAAAGRDDVAAVVLLDPVVRGDAYVAQQRRLHEQWMALEGRIDHSEPAAGVAHVLGFPQRADALEALARMDAARIRLRPSTDVRIVLSDEHGADAAWRAGVRSVYGSGSVVVVPPAIDWDSATSVHTALSPQPALQAMASMLTATRAHA